jgi:transcription elongation factor Elf1
MLNPVADLTINPKSFNCPRCGAKSENACVTPFGDAMETFHIARVEKASAERGNQNMVLHCTDSVHALRVSVTAQT